MKYALINPPWSFEGSIYFGCREAHLPLEFGYSEVLLERAGHEARIFDAQLQGLSRETLRDQVRAWNPDFVVVTTAPSYLFWRCAPPELRVPIETCEDLRGEGRTLVVVGPHASTTPRSTLRKLQADVVVLGECEEILPQLSGRWPDVPSIAYRRGDEIRLQGGPHSCDVTELPALHWSRETLARHTHHHHRFDAQPGGPGAELEASRGCPYHCTFCAKDNFRDSYRKRPVPVILEELDGLRECGVEYVYFIDEIFLPNRPLLEEMRGRGLKFGIQTRIDLWNQESIDLLGQAGCVSIEAGVESITPEGRAALDKKCRMSTDELADRLIYAKSRVPFVQANLLEMEEDQADEIERWRERLLESGVWSNKPVPLFAYPGSPEYRRRWGAEDDRAWERAHEAYLAGFDEFSDIQEQRPSPLIHLEAVKK